MSSQSSTTIRAASHTLIIIGSGSTRVEASLARSPIQWRLRQYRVDEWRQHLSASSQDDVSVIVIDVDVAKPLQVCRMIRAVAPKLAIVVLCEDRDAAAMQQRIQMTPAIGEAIQILPRSRLGSMSTCLSDAIASMDAQARLDKILVSVQRQVRPLSYSSISDDSHFDHMLENLPLGIITVGLDDSLQYTNPKARELLGLDQAHQQKLRFGELLDESIREPILRQRKDCAVRQRKIEAGSFAFPTSTGVKQVLISMMPLSGRSPSHSTLVMLQDITAYHRAQADLRDLQRDYGQMVSNMQDVFWTGSTDFSRIDYVSPAFSKIWGRPSSFLDRNPGRFIHTVLAEDRSRLLELKEQLSDTGHGSVQFRIERPDGQVRWIEARTSLLGDKLAGVATDITEKKQAELRVHELLTRDSLTGLLNRKAFCEVLTRELNDARQEIHKLAVMYLDLDGFKTVNDSLGHQRGDQLIVSLAQRLSDTLRREDIIGRLGGDEFVVLVKVTNEEELVSIANKLLERCAATYQLDGYRVSVSASIGISLASNSAKTAEELLQNADTAMYRSKKLGRNTFKFFEDDMNRSALERLNLETHMRDLVAQQKLALHYQPKHCLRTNRVIGAEALVRFQTPELAAHGVHEMIQLAEETGFIIPIGKWAFRNACEQIKIWQDQGLMQEGMSVAINLSAKQLVDQDVTCWMSELIEELGIPASCINIELTESAIMSSSEVEFEVLNKLRKIGIQISIDDFGTGYSSFSRLKQLPIDVLKIDRSFINEIFCDKVDLAICKGIIKMAHELGLLVVAEGVESQRQFELLREIGCDQLQGFYLSQPLCAERMSKYLKDGGQNHPGFSADSGS